MIKFLLIYFLISSNIVAQEFEIFYTEQANNNDNIFVINQKGERRQLSHHNRKDSSPILSPDGKSIVFTSERKGWWKIWLMDIEQNLFTQLTDASSAEYSPSWSPNGKKIIFVSSRDGNEEIYSMDRDGKNLNNITKNSDSDITPFWGSDNKIYFSTEIDGKYQIARINADGSNKEILTKNYGNKFMPQLSNDLTKVLFYGDQDGNLEIYMMTLKNKSIERVTNNPLVDRRARWSPNNKEIVFERGNKRNNHHIYMMNLETKKTTQLTFTNYNYSPSFGSVGKRLIKN